MNTEAQRNLLGTLFAIFLIATIVLAFDDLGLRSRVQGLEAENERMDSLLFKAQEDVEAERQKVYSLQDDLSETEAGLAATQASLASCNESYALLSGKHLNCTKENYLLTTSLSDTRDEIEDLSESLTNFEEEIAQSMEWFTDNSNTNSMATRLKMRSHECSQGDEVNLACIPLVMEEEEGWSYHVEPRDRLLSFDEMAWEGGGDCEDWSLFFKGTINYLRQRGAGKDQDLIAWQPGPGSFTIYNGWYYENAAPRKVGTIDDNVYVICYDSHCVVAISPETIIDSSDIPKLEGSPAIEPQNGQYLFTIGDGFGHEVCSPSSCDTDDIFIVITDDDIYEHYNVGWLGYKDFLGMSVDYQLALAEYMEFIDSKLTQ